MLNRMNEAMDNILQQEQAGRKGRSYCEQIFTLRQIIEKVHARDRSLYISFVHFQKVFDSIHRMSLREILKCYGIPEKLRNIIKSFYDGGRSNVRINGLLSDWLDWQVFGMVACFCHSCLQSLRTGVWNMLCMQLTETLQQYIAMHAFAFWSSIKTFNILTQRSNRVWTFDPWSDPTQTLLTRWHDPVTECLCFELSTENGVFSPQKKQQSVW